jgi:hypothetical protein
VIRRPGTVATRSAKARAGLPRALRHVRCSARLQHANTSGGHPCLLFERACPRPRHSMHFRNWSDVVGKPGLLGGRHGQVLSHRHASAQLRGLRARRKPREESDVRFARRRRAGAQQTFGRRRRLSRLGVRRWSAARRRRVHVQLTEARRIGRGRARLSVAALASQPRGVILATLAAKDRSVQCR